VIVGFSPFGATHALAAGVALGGMIAWIAAGARLRRADAARERSLVRVVAVLWLLQQAFSTLWWLLPANFDPGASLPLHLCDVVGWLGPFALLMDDRPSARWLRTCLYFWGIGLSSQAFITPTLEHGPADTRFWLFWISHTLIVGGAAYDAIVRGYRPHARDLLVAIGCSAAWAVPMVALNAATGFNYGYLGPELDGTTILNALPGWPWRPLAMGTIVAVLFSILWAIWPITAALTARRRGAAAATDTYKR